MDCTGVVTVANKVVPLKVTVAAVILAVVPLPVQEKDVGAAEVSKFTEERLIFLMIPAVAVVNVMVAEVEAPLTLEERIIEGEPSEPAATSPLRLASTRNARIICMMLWRSPWFFWDEL